MKTHIEPFRIKVVEPLRLTTEEERSAKIQQAGYNVFLLHSDDVLIDLLTDSGTSAMSAAQWGAMMQADEAYAGSESFYRFRAAVREITGMPHVIPTHQGRAAESILLGLLVERGQVVLSNTFFDTTRANVDAVGAQAVDLPHPSTRDLQADSPFKGDIDLDQLDQTLTREGRSKIPLVVLTVTNNAVGGQPVSLANIRGAAEICRHHGVRFILDACRFAENAWFIREREPGHQGRPIRDIALDMFRLADGCTMSAKKDGLANMGGFLALREDALAERARTRLLLTEGFPTYGGLAGRDLEAVAAGLREVLDEAYMADRVGSVAFLASRLEENGVSIVRPPGGHAVYVDARQMLPRVPLECFPGLSVVVGLYIHAGVRAVEVGGVMFGGRNKDGSYLAPSNDLVRLAIPRRVYTRSHLEYVAEALGELAQNSARLPGFRFSYEAPSLRHFTSRFQQVET